MFRALTDYGITGRAVDQGLITLQCWNPRDFTQDKHRTVDDRPYGGGPGMLLKVATSPDAIAAANACAAADAPEMYMSPHARPATETVAAERTASPGMPAA